MKVVCDGCQAKYKLTDGRLAGRKLKFRCRKCGNTIVIDGAELSHHASNDTLELSLPAEGFTQESVAAFESSASEWYLSINGEPYGPCTTEQMASMLGDGQVPWDTYVWREGYAEWKAASDSRTLVRAVHELSAQAERDASLDREHDGMPAERGYDDDWEAPRRGSSPDRYDAEHGGVDGAGFDGAPHREEPTKVGYVDPHTGRLAYGGDDASGLIDIRALAALAGSQRNPRFSARRSPSGAHSPDDDRFALTSPGERLRGPNGVDTLAPVARTRTVAGKAVPLAILGGSALIAVAAFAAIYSTPAPGESSAALTAHDEQAIAPPHDPPQIAEQAAPSGQVAPSGVPSAPEPAHPPDTANAVPAEGTDTDSAAIEAAAIKERKAAMALARSERAKRAAEAAAAATQADAPKADAATATSSSATSAATPAATPVAAAADEPAADEPPAPSTPGAKPATGNARSIDELLEGAVVDSDAELDGVLASAGKAPEPAVSAEAAVIGTPGASSGAGLQAMPTREQVLAAMRAVEPDVRSCTEGQALDSYTAAAAFSVTGATGRVGSVRVTGIQGPVGSCIARAVRNAIFPPFAKSQLRINFPFRLGP
jgi:predicted Zn finger-like uncharacterized protein